MASPLMKLSGCIITEVFGRLLWQAHRMVDHPSTALTGTTSIGYCTGSAEVEGGRRSMPLLIRKYKLAGGLSQEERIDDPDRIERYLRIFEREDVKKLETGQKVWIEKDEWQLLP
jgi:hypothetical protein